MSANLFDAGDIQRLDREATLTEQAPRQLPEEDRSPNEEFLDTQDELQDESSDDNGIALMLRGLALVLERRNI